MMAIPPKHSGAGTNIFSVMSALAAEHQAINLSQGFPDFEIDEQLKILLKEAALSGHHQYAPMPGLACLRERIAEGMGKRHRITPDPVAEITITPGATYAIYTACAAVLQPGDEAILLEPAYDSYRPNIETNGAKAVAIPMTFPDFRPDWQKIREAITPRTRLIIFNTPHNPTGTIWGKEDFDMLADIVRDTKIYLISDEVYEQLVFDGKKHYSILTHPELRARSFAVFSFGKTFNNTGWKIGYIIAPPGLTGAFREIHQFLAFSVHTPAQYALSAYLNRPERPDVSLFLQKKRDYFLELFKDLPFKIHAPAAGSYFQLADYRQISDLPDTAFARWLTTHHGVAVIPVSAFYHNGQDDQLVRFCFAKKETTLLAAHQRLSALKS